MIIFWVREIAGWLLIILGLYAFKVAYSDLIMMGKPVQAAPLVFMGFIIFRGGIHLVKVAVAIRLSREGLEEARKRSPTRSPSKLVVERRTVIPGTGERDEG